MAVTNLATVYLTAQRPADALRVLYPLLRGQTNLMVRARNPADGRVWANIGMAREQLGAYRAAVEAYQRALGADPSLAGMQFRLAAVWMDHLGEPILALDALRSAHDQGHVTGLSAVRFMVCLTALGAEEEAAQVYAELRENMRPEDLPRMERDRERLIALLRERMAEPEPDRAPDLPEPFLAEEEFRHAERGVPFLNFRVDLEQRWYLVAWFDSPAEPGYLERFRDALEDGREEREFDQQGLVLRDLPFHFTVCPGCDGTVLTNYPKGKRLVCRWCATEAPVSPVVTAELQALLDDLPERMGWRVADAERLAQVLMVDTTGEHRRDRVVALAAEAGFQLVPPTHQIAAALLVNAAESGLVRLDNPYRVFFWKLVPPGSVIHWERTPPEIDQLVERIRATIGPVITTSTTYAADPGDGASVPGVDLNEVIEAFAADPDDPYAVGGLAEFAMSRGDLAEAERHTRAGLARWPDQASWWSLLGRIHLRADRPAEAAEALLRSLRIDPVQPMMLELLAVCLDRLNRPEEATAARVQAAGLGGPWGLR
jgi:tetratricopeptide (TPR) repeat protein